MHTCFSVRLNQHASHLKLDPIRHNMNSTFSFLERVVKETLPSLWFILQTTCDTRDELQKGNGDTGDMT